MKVQWAWAVLFSLAICVTSAHAEIKRGESAGTLSLTGLSDYQIPLNNYATRPATAILFLSARCPVFEANHQKIWDIHQKYRRKDVLFVGIVSDPDQSPDEIRDFMHKRGFMFPVYRDPDNSIRRRFGATVTPEIFLLDNDGKLTYHGGLDRDQSYESLELAILSLLKKVPANVPDVPPQGTSMDAELAPIARIDPNGTISFRAEMIFEQIKGVAAYHCSTLTQAANGDLLCLWYGGSYESADDESLFLARLKPGTREWSKPQRLISNPTQPPGNGIMFVDGLKRLWLVWARLESPRPIGRGKGWNHCRLMYRTSADHGETWTDDKPLLQEGIWGVPRNNPLVLKSGKILLPVEAIIGKDEGSVFLGTSDNGQTWETSSLLENGSQPVLAQRADGSVLSLMRAAPKITQSESRDEGRTWTKAVPTTVNNPDSGISMTRLKNGHLILVYNDSPDERTPLNIVRSIDDGKTWEKPLALESNPGEYSYPCVIQTDDGKIHITYTFRRYGIKHVQMNETWLTSFEHIPN
ncbi:MAG: exo-alpha-sialidase [Planctomycetales bacterium]